MKKIYIILIILLTFLASGCKNNNSVDLSGFNLETRNAIYDFVKLYGNKSKNYNENSYVVSDFDNTTSIFDITYQCSVYQLETMSFAVDADELEELLRTSLNLDSVMINYIDDIKSSYITLISEYGAFSAQGIEESELENLHNNIYWQEFACKMKCLYLYVEEMIDDALACEWILYWYTNMSEDEVYNLFKRSCIKYEHINTKEVTWTSPSTLESKSGVCSCSFLLGCSVTNSVKNMLKLYKENGIDVWICSASHVDGVRAAVDAFGISDSICGVIGMTQKVVNGKFIAMYDYVDGYPYENKGNGNWEKANHPIKALPSREGKVEAISNSLVEMYGCGPLAGFMDASGDFNFCTEFSSLKMVICYNRANRKITEGAGLVAIAAMYQKDKNMNLKKANDNNDTYYLLQGRDENGERSLRESNYTLQFGSNIEKLFANEENTVLFDYVKNNSLTLKEFFDKFAIYTNEQKSVINITYGYLESYDGYHSK